MSPGEVTDIIRQMLFNAALIAAPILLLTLLIGLGVSIFQSVTQITEMTLLFIPKLLCFTVVFALTLPWIMKILMKFSEEILVVHWGRVMDIAANSL